MYTRKTSTNTLYMNEVYINYVVHIVYLHTFMDQIIAQSNNQTCPVKRINI